MVWDVLPADTCRMRKLRAIGGLIVLTAIAGATSAAYLMIMARELLNAAKATPETGAPPIGNVVRSGILLAIAIAACVGLVAFARRPRRARRVVYRTRTVHRARTAV